MLTNIEPNDALVDLGKAIGKILPILSIFHGREAHGGYLCIADSETGLPRLIVGIGTVDAKEEGKCFELCQEQARRLAQNPEHSSSAQSRDDDNGKFGGAIRGLNEIFAFSGSWELDEAFCLLLALELADIGPIEAKEIADPSRNARFEEILEYYEKHS